MQKTRVLIIDDEFPLILPGCGAGEDTGLEFHTAATASEGLRIMDVLDFQIVLLDMSLPDGSGYDVCREIRNLYIQKPVQIILLSSCVDDERLRPTLEAGGDDFIRKPVSGLELEMRLQAAVIRLKGQSSLLQEREFYRQAVRQEEEITARVFSQNLLLKRAYRSVENIRLELEESNQELMKLASLDTLSGLLNRSSLFSMLDVEIDRSRRSNRPLSGIMMDVDHFKAINDTYGHQCGDAVIQAIGTRLRERLRKYDIAGRYGGEEFFVALPDTCLERAAVIAKRFMGDLRSLLITWNGHDISLSASMGVAEYRPSETRDIWIARVDRAMYTAKERGRARVVVE